MKTVRITSDINVSRLESPRLLCLADVEFEVEFIGRTPPTDAFPSGHSVETWRGEHLTVHVIHHADKNTSSLLVWPQGDNRYLTCTLTTFSEDKYHFVRHSQSFIGKIQREVVELVMQVIGGNIDKAILKEDV